MAKKVYVGVESEIALPNLVVNGDFSGGFTSNQSTGWTNYGGTYLTIESGQLKGVGGATYRYAFSNKIQFAAGHKYYVCADYKKSGGGTSRFGIYSVSTGTEYWLKSVDENTSAFKRISNIFTENATVEANLLLYAAGVTSASDLVIYWDNAMVVDLTAHFGAGNEPTIDWCDENIRCYGASAYIKDPNIARLVKKMYVGVPEVSMSNLIQDNNFANTSYWTASKSSYTVSGNVATVTPTGTWAQILAKSVSVTSGHIYYNRCSIKYSTTASVTSHTKMQLKQAGANGAALAGNAYSGSGVWEVSSGVGQFNYNSMDIVLALPVTSSSGTYISGLSAYFTEPMLIDLTNSFGSGNEPTKEWCDENIPYFSGTTFLVTDKVVSTAKKVKKGYIGNANGIAQLFYPSVSIDIGTTYTYTSNGTFTVPADGRYSIEIHGGGGGGGGAAMAKTTIGGNRYAVADGGDGGGSGDTFTAQLEESTSYTITIGTGGTGGSKNSAEGRSSASCTGYSGGDGTASSFGSLYTVEGGKGGAGGSAVRGGTSSTGATGASSGSLASGSSGGATTGTYGNGGSGGIAYTDPTISYNDGSAGQLGFIKITYLGE